MYFISTAKRRALQPLWSSLEQTLGPHLQQGILLAISGGPDSRALLESIAVWPKRNVAKILVVSIDHGQRPQAKQESELVVMRARALGFKSQLESFFSPIALGEQELRELRYRALTRIAHEHGCLSICTAHHMDDNAEGFLMALFGCGGGANGASMNEQEAVGKLNLLRPFLSLSKNQLLLALTMLKQTDYAVDNFDENRLGKRAYLRHEIMPFMADHLPGIKGRLNLFARLQYEQNEVLKQHSSHIIEWVNEQEAVIRTQGVKRAILAASLRQVLLKLSQGKDLRQVRPTLTKILDLYCQPGKQGLDQSPNLFNVNQLKEKQFSLPGVIAQVFSTKIVIKCV